jgi:hypothetical protein
MNDLYHKLVDMYAGRELPAELEEEMLAASAEDLTLAKEMTSMRDAVDAIRSIPSPEFTEESYQRVLMKVYARGVAMQPQTPTPVHLQYSLPIQG